VARDPDAIQREIEQTRAELADTIDAIADRVSPKRAAARGGRAVKTQVASVRRLRRDRVLIVLGVVAAVAAGIGFWRTRRR
jgi:hypothetical protein